MPYLCSSLEYDRLSPRAVAKPKRTYGLCGAILKRIEQLVQSLMAQCIEERFAFVSISTNTVESLWSGRVLHIWARETFQCVKLQRRVLCQGRASNLFGCAQVISHVISKPF